MHQVKHAVHEAFKEALQDPTKLAALQDGTSTKDKSREETITEWLSKLKLLDGVPFYYLVAGEGMLPKESIRFFYVDPNWITAVVDGAFSLGTTTYSDVAHDTVHAPILHQKAHECAHQHRAQLLGQPLPSTEAAQGPITGFILRSMAVSAFPGLEVEGYQGTTKLDILRMEHLSKDILLCLFKGELGTLEIHNPPEGLHFGLDIEKQEKFTKSLKTMNSEKPEKNGCSIDDSAIEITKGFYRNEKNTLKIETLASAIKQKLTEVGYPPTQFTAAEFALQMIEGVDMAKLEPRSQK